MRENKNKKNKFEELFPILIFFTARDTNEIMLLAFILRFVDFYEGYKLRPDSYFIQC
jgi:hypothetical protein